MLIEGPCPTCETEIRTALAGDLAGEVGRFDAYCAHAGVGVSLRINRGRVIAWTAWSASTVDDYRQHLAFRAGAEAGMLAALEAEAAVDKAAGRPLQ